MDFEFLATDASFTSDGEVEVLSFVDQSSAPRDYLIFQRATNPDSQDMALGQDVYYVEVAEDGVCGYGGIDKVRVEVGVIEFVISRGAEWRDELESVRVRHSFSVEKLTSIKNGIQRIFSGCGVGLDL
ncbi:Imm10 family immunity protein [Serratia nevei]|uniref:Imm10 family immunity protein n=1 Tax=Serratia nevei TaxID=2703794 RepID=UPI00209F2990|nr:Imm10 family immunity protein [Serratia nevei]MCP1107733.1 Imm10 family immunity protein [Serratia nevei]